MSSPLKFAYVCTNYNNSQFTSAAVASLQSGTHPADIIVVVDNASDEANVAELKALAERFETVRLILNSDNLGYFPGLNQGICEVGNERPDIQYMVIGNNDLEFPPDFGEKLCFASSRLDACPVISPNVITLDDIHQNPHVISGISRRRELIYDLYYANYHLAGIIRKLAQWTHGLTDRSDESQHEIPQFIYQGHGSCYILTPRFFSMFEKLWAPTFLMGEEFFLSKQLSDRGTQIFYEPTIVVRHHCNGAIKNVPSRRMWELARDAHRVYRRYVKPWDKQGSMKGFGNKNHVS